MPLICDQEIVEAFKGVIALTGALVRVWETGPSEIDDGVAKFVSVLENALAVLQLSGLTNVFVLELGDVCKIDWLESNKEVVELANVLVGVVTWDAEELEISGEAML